MIMDELKRFLFSGRSSPLRTAVLSACMSCLFATAHASDGYIEHGRHHLSVFHGNTQLDDHDDTTEFTAGLDYEYRVNSLLGVGAVVEQAFGDIDALTALAVADIHIYKGLILQTGPGYEWTGHADEPNRAVYRIGGLYEFEIGGYTVSPQLHLDLVDEGHDAWVFGLAFGKAF